MKIKVSLFLFCMLSNSRIACVENCLRSSTFIYFQGRLRPRPDVELYMSWTWCKLAKTIAFVICIGFDSCKVRRLALALQSNLSCIRTQLHRNNPFLAMKSTINWKLAQTVWYLLQLNLFFQVFVLSSCTGTRGISLLSLFYYSILCFVPVPEYFTRGQNQTSFLCLKLRREVSSYGRIDWYSLFLWSQRFFNQRVVMSV